MKNNIQLAKKILKKGGIVVYPTDTAYALGCKFRNKKGIKKILQIKKRKDNKFTLIASSLAQVKKYFLLNSCELKIAKKYWPGPVSIVVSPKYSIRVPKNNIARKLARAVKEPIIATSLNISGEKTIYDLRRERTRAFRTKVDAIINIGPLTKRKTSTIIQCLNKKTPGFKPGDIKIIRHGQTTIRLPA